jgi:UDPglucose 6-dehydrogenase
MRIAVIGSGYVGLVAGACFAEIGHQVTLVDNDPAKYSSLLRGEIPIHEAFLPELFARHSGHRLSFSSSTADAVRRSAAIFIAVGTPPLESGHADLSYVESVARDIAEGIDDYKVVVGKSTVPVYTSEWVRKTISLSAAGSLFDVASNPEFLREGTAVTDFLCPDRIVIGADNIRCAKILTEIYQPLTSGSYYASPSAITVQAYKAAPLIITSARSAELIKHASNAFLAMKISYINAVASICEAVGADIDEVCQGIGADPRIGKQFLKPGIGYGGSCFPKDVSAFRTVASQAGFDFALLDQVIRINREQRDRFVQKVRTALWTLRDKKIGVLGLAFKGGTDDTRESPALAIVEMLLAEGCEVSAYDPAAMQRAREVITKRRIEFVRSPYEAARGADALLVLTDWEEFKELDLARLRVLLRQPLIIDGRNIYRPSEMVANGITYLSIGRREVVPTEVSSRAVDIRECTNLSV